MHNPIDPNRQQFPWPSIVRRDYFFLLRNFSLTVRLHIPPSLIGLPSPCGGGVSGGVIGLARPLDEFRPTLPSSTSDISSEVFSSHESKRESSRLLTME